MMDDVLVENDLERQRTAVEILAEHAADGQQIVLLTCHLHLREACRSRGGRVIDLAGGTTTDPTDPPRPDVERSRSSTRTHRVPRPPLPATANRPSAAARSRSAETSAADTGVSRRHRRPSGANTRIDQSHSRENEDFALALDDGVRRLPRVTRQRARVLVLADIRTIRDLLALEADDDLSVLTGHGIDLESIARWQAEARWLVTVPGLRASDASALVEMGLLDAETLLALDESEFDGRLRRLHGSRIGRGLLQSGRRFDRTWLRGARSRARRARSLDGAGRGSRSRRRRSGGGSGRGRPNRTVRRPRREREPRDARRTRTSRDRNRDRDDRDRRERTRRDRTRDERREDRADVLPMQAESSERELRFHLERSSAVVDAPSIGPKTAKRLERIGIRTVDELLAADADSVASRIESRHVTPDVVRAWQDQARLVCRIPELRGHDAQILIACEVTTPEEVAAFDARTLLAKVTPFCRTSAGKRIIRSGRAPDLEEVTDWINWSRSARTLRAA